MAHLGLLMAVCLCVHWQFVAAARKLLSIEKEERNEQKLPGYPQNCPRTDVQIFQPFCFTLPWAVKGEKSLAENITCWFP